jgi:hypothetical protein
MENKFLTNYLLDAWVRNVHALHKPLTAEMYNKAQMNKDLT